jgi:hypothetical protein
MSEQNEIVTGVFRRKHIEIFYAAVAIFIIAIERTADRYLSPFYLNFLDSLKSEPSEITEPSRVRPTQLTNPDNQTARET